MRHPLPTSSSTKRIVPSARRKGAALIIALAFVVLLTGLLMAFFSRAINERMVSNSSANQTKVELLALGAADLIIGELKQEIVANSSSTAIVTGSGNSAVTTTLYVPVSPNAMMPSMVGSTGSNGMENVLKISLSGSSSTTTPSLNGRHMTGARWNKALFMPVTSGTNYSPALKTGTFTPPNWIPLARSGTVPAIADFSGGNRQFMAGGTNPILGRYAFVVYHEGGLLDANVAGYPSTTNANQISCKSAESFADLSLAFIAAGLSATSATKAVDKLVAWRNYVSAQPTMGMASPGFTAASGSSYCASILANRTGFLSTSGTGLVNGESDRMFVSRHELIDFIHGGLGISGTNLNVLNYLTTFSRELNQPSFAPDRARPKIPALARTGTGTGANSAGGTDPVSGEEIADLINPSFQCVRVSANGTRNDGSLMVPGEPLVKKRFSLNRLAWLTYVGPITLDGVTYNPSLPPSYVTALKIKGGFTDAFLKQGTPVNVYKHFGLAWVSDTRSMTQGDNQLKWVYDHSSLLPPNQLPITSGSGIEIKRIGDVAHGGREVDFFELLKASLTAGSKAKAATLAQGGGNKDTDGVIIGLTNPSNYQSIMDTTLEYAIVQIGANIIDQFDLDGFPTRILYNSPLQPNVTREFAGVENLPYLYRIRNGYAQGRQPVYTACTFNTAGTMLTTGTVADTGFLVIMQFPELWNPHDSTSPRCALDSNGQFLSDSTSAMPLYPTTFRVVADSIDPDHINPTGASYNNVAGTIFSNLPGGCYAANSNTGCAPGAWASAKYGVHTPFTSNTQMQTPTFPLYVENTALEFTVNEKGSAKDAGYFREPTVLCKPTQLGNTLKAGGAANILNPGAPYSNATPTNHANIKSCLDGSGAVKCTDNNNYLGIYYGTVPAAFYNQAGGAICGATWDTGSSVNFITYRVQYEYPTGSGKWQTYDAKYMHAEACGDVQYVNTPKANSQPAGGIFMGLSETCDFHNCAYDPRTARFSIPWGGGGANSANNPPGGNGVPTQFGWLDSTSMIAMTARPDYSSGFSIRTEGLAGTGSNQARCLPQAAGWPVTPAATNSALFGLISQNNPIASTNGKAAIGLSYQVPASGAYSDPDGVVRRAMGAYVASNPSSAVGLPMATANSYAAGNWMPTSQNQSRPIVLNRPFKSVAELGYVFSSTPWKNLDFFTPESGDTALLDVFTVSGETDDPSELIAGKVNLNTRQPVVLRAILAGAYKDEQASYSTSPSWKLAGLSATETTAISNILIARTTDPTKGPLRNLGELVGKYSGAPNAQGQPYDGFSADLSTVFGAATANIQRMREAPIRALAACGQTRVWNLLIDVVAQTGRYPASATSPDMFFVEAEKRYWVHVAIDRFTGKVIDRQIEVVKE